MSGVDLPAWTMLLPVAGYAVALLIALVSSTAGRRGGPEVSLVTAASALAGIGIAVNALVNGDTQFLDGWRVFDGIRFDLRLDPVAAFFLLVISLPSVAAAIYGIGYLDAAHEPAHGHHGPEPRAGIDGAVAAFLASMSLLVLADGVFSFLVSWELMSLISFFLVIGNGSNAVRRSAAYTYVVMTHVATAFIVFAFLGLAQHAGGFAFDDLRAGAASLGGWQRNAIFVCALLGFGTKAGLIPVHVWLPKAHPAAPSHVSALMSGVMVKTAIYGLIRVVFELAGPGPRWWGIALLAVGAVSALLGILYALMERDVKRVLAYSTVEHLGIMTLGLGAAVYLANDSHPTGASIALTAVLIHLLNHTVFKSLLFLGAGAVQTGAGTRDLERLGGLVRRMPRTAIFVLVGCASIAALPPLNGFAGEWLLFQSLLTLGGSGGARIATIAAVAAGALALTGALAVAAFVRLYGTGFLAQPRTAGAQHAHEVPRSMQIGMGLLATCCAVFGFGAVFLMRLIGPVPELLTGSSERPRLLALHDVNVRSTSGSYAPLFVIAGLLVVGVLPWIVARASAGTGRVRLAPPWVCGFRIEPGMQYTATAFSKILRLVFQFLIRPERTIVLERPDSPYVVAGIRYDEGVQPVYDRYLYGNLVKGIIGTSRRVRPLQSGSIRAYLGYVLVTLVVVILLAR